MDPDTRLQCILDAIDEQDWPKYRAARSDMDEWIGKGGRPPVGGNWKLRVTNALLKVPSGGPSW
jgi:hypothetical protein